MYGSWTKNVVDNFSESFETYSEVFTVHICSTREQIQSDSKKFVVSILLETPGGILFSLEGLQKMPFTIKTLRGRLTFHWRDSDILPWGIIIPLEGFSYPS